ncbi:MAG: TetR/AcrR family transcriptional regulator [Granulosicoccus sp.]
MQTIHRPTDRTVERTKSKQNSWRGSEKLWLDAAYEMLVESGVESVKVMPLAKQLKLSRTSFYWHFKSREALLDALVDRWQEKNTGNLVAQTERYAETITEAMLNLFDCWIEPQLFDSAMDFAIRNWAHQSADLNKILQQADQKRVAAIRAMFLRFEFDQERAEAHALTVYYTQVGYISMLVAESVQARLARMPTYVKIYTSQYPTDSEIARFMARNQNLTEP